MLYKALNFNIAHQLLNGMEKATNEKPYIEINVTNTPSQEPAWQKLIAVCKAQLPEPINILILNLSGLDWKNILNNFEILIDLNEELLAKNKNLILHVAAKAELKKLEAAGILYAFNEEECRDLAMMVEIEREFDEFE